MAVGAMLLDYGVQGIGREERHAAGRQRRHFDHQRIIGVQDRSSSWQYNIDGGAFHLEHVGGRVNISLAKMIGLANVRDNGHVAFVEPQPFAQDSAPCHFKHRGIDQRIQQHVPGTARAGAIALFDQSAVDRNTVRTSHSDVEMCRSQNGIHQASAGCLAVCAGDRN